MSSVCAWCLVPLDDATEPTLPISHGICEPCVLRLEYRLQPLTDFIQSLPGAVMAVDAGGRAADANDRLLAMVGKQRADIIDRLGGEVISCIYSELPEGCGETVHCLGCSIRNAVGETRESGEPKDHVPAFAYVRTPDGGVAKLLLTISTERAGTLVLLRVDEATPVESDRPDIRR